MQRLRPVLIAMLCLATILFSDQKARAVEALLPGEMIRVAIIKGADSVTVAGNGLLAVNESGRAQPFEYPLVVRSESGKLVTVSDSFRVLRLAASDTVLVNGKPYRGLVELSLQGGKLLVVNELPLEQYLVGVITSEISSSWPMEAIKAQAVIARTYAMVKKEERSGAFYHLESTVMDQAYNGSAAEDNRAARGVRETEGEVLTYNGELIQAFYHANSGGRTEASENVWGMDLPYLRGVECQYGLTSPTSSWELTLPLSRIESLLRANGQRIATIRDIKAGPRNSRSRLKTVLLVTSRGVVSMPATKFRMDIGSTSIKSTNFTVRVAGDTAIFSGAGYGHGVGLCQYGAKQRALDGFSYDEILTYYYPGTQLNRLSELN